MRLISRQVGVTILEVLLALSISAIVIATAVRYYREASRSTQVVRAQKQFNVIYKASYDWLGQQSQASFLNLTKKELTDSGLVDNQDFSLPWIGGSIDIDPSQKLTIAVTMPNGALCLRLANLLANVETSVHTGNTATLCTDTGRYKGVFSGSFPSS